MKKIISMIFLLCFISCNKPGSTDIEINAVQQVLNFYNGVCLKHKGFELKNGIEKQYFELEISESNLLQNSTYNIQSHAGNIAYLFYTNLKNEKLNYDEIRVKINLKESKSQEFKYSTSDLKEIESLQSDINQINNYVLTKDYDGLHNKFSSSIEIKKENIEKLFTLIENKFGVIKKIQFQGFCFAKTDYGEVIIFNEALCLEKINAEINIILKRDNKQLISIEIP